MNWKIMAFALVAVFMLVTVTVAQQAPQPTPVNSLTVLAPTAGEKWEENTSQVIAWNLTPITTPDSIQITLFQKVAKGYTAKGELLTTIIKDNPGQWKWLKVRPVGEKMKLEVKAFLPKKHTVKGSQVFNIVAAAPIPSPVPPAPPVLPITVKSPNGGESWRIGHEEPILWTIQPNAFPGLKYTVDVYLSRDNGKTFAEQIASGLDLNMTEWKYTVTGTTADKCIVKVTVSAKDATVPPVFDVSDATFRIVSEIVQPGENTPVQH
jgi:hypothetical protein